MPEGMSTKQAIQRQTMKGVGPDGQPDELLTDGYGRPVVVGRLFATARLQAAYGATSGAHDAGDALGDPMLFRVPRRGRILSMKLWDPDDDTLVALAHVYNKEITAAASDAAYTIGLADSPGWVTTQTFPITMIDEGSFKVVEITDINSDYVAPDGLLVVQLSTAGTPTVASQATMPLLQMFILPMQE